MKQLIKTLEANLLGRDFVVGDLHGSLSCLVTLLAGVNFNPEVDRLISCADLVDRGEDSLGCLRLIGEPWFHAVAANHEQMMLDAFKGGYIGAFWIPNGGSWGLEALRYWQKIQQRRADPSVPLIVPDEDSLELFELLPLVDELPLLITINRPDGKKFHVIHAEFPPNMEVTDEILADPEKVRELNSVMTSDGEHIVWGRYIFRSFYKASLDNRQKIVRTVKHGKLDRMFNDKLSHIISGHTIVQRPLTIVGQTNIDTGAYGSRNNDATWEKLTMVELGSWKFYQATATTFNEVEPTVVNRSDLEEIGDGKATEGSRD